MPDKQQDEDKMKQSEAERKGGKAAHEKGTTSKGAHEAAHEKRTTSEEARKAGHKGDEASHEQGSKRRDE